MAVAYVNYSIISGQIPILGPNQGGVTVSTLSPSAGAATSATLSANWGNASGTWDFYLSNGAVALSATFTNGSPTVTWSVAVSGATGAGYAAGYVPGAAGHQIYLLPNSNGGNSLSFTVTGSATTLSVQPVSSVNNFGDGVGNSYSLWDNLSCASGLQYWTVTQPNGDYTGVVPILEFSGGVATKSPLYTVTASPGATAGAITGQAVTVASGDILVAAVYDGTSPFGTICTVNGPTGSSSPVTYSSTRVSYWAGTGGSMTPTFTAATGYTTDTYVVIQWVVSATATGTTITPSVGSEGLTGVAPVLVTNFNFQPQTA